MRYATLVIRWDGVQLHPLDDAVASAPDVQIERTFYINPVGDGSYVELCRFRGEQSAIAAVLRDAPSVLDFEASDGSDGVTYVHYESAPLLDAMLDVLFENAVVLTWPVEFVHAGGGHGIRVTLLGTERAIGESLDAIPTGVDVELERTGDYAEHLADPVASLTDRQREILEVAVRSGYYEVPRETTHRELAAALDVAPGTVSTQLQRIERMLVSSLVDVDG